MRCLDLIAGQGIPCVALLLRGMNWPHFALMVRLGWGSLGHSLRASPATNSCKIGRVMQLRRHALFVHQTLMSGSTHHLLMTDRLLLHEVLPHMQLLLEQILPHGGMSMPILGRARVLVHAQHEQGSKTGQAGKAEHADGQKIPVHFFLHESQIR